MIERIQKTTTLSPPTSTLKIIVQKSSAVRRRRGHAFVADTINNRGGVVHLSPQRPPTKSARVKEGQLQFQDCWSRRRRRRINMIRSSFQLAWRRRGLPLILLLVLLVGIGRLPQVGATLEDIGGSDPDTRWLQTSVNDTAAATNGTVNTESTCPPCPQCQVCDTTATAPPATQVDKDKDTPSPSSNTSQEEPLTLQILVVDSIGIINMVAWNARDYEEFTGGKVKIVIKKVPTMPELFAEIEHDARTGGSLFDAYYTNPVILGTAAILNGFLDLTPFVKESPYADWTDVLLALRTYVTSFEDKIYIILLDGDTHTLFYRRDVLEHFGLQPPRTWNEYTEVAKAVHGQVFEGQELYGSCVSRIDGDHAMYWSHLLLSTITQTEGTATGSLFDTSDMTPLTGEAMAEMLRLHEMHNQYGAPDGKWKRERRRCLGRLLRSIRVFSHSSLCCHRIHQSHQLCE